MERFFRVLINNVDTSLAIILGIIAAVIDTLGILEGVLLPAIAAILALLAAGIMRDRHSRDNLVSEIQKLESVITKLDNKPSADTFFTFNTSETHIIADAHEEVWLLQETGSLVIEQNFESLERLINGGGILKIVIPSDSQHIVDLIAFRNKNLREVDTIRSRQTEAVEKFRSLLNATSTGSGSVEIRQIEYPLDVTAVFVDPESSIPNRRIGLIRMVGFRNYFKNKRDFIVSFNESPTTFQLFVDQFREMWNQGHPLLIEK